jgi:hypothetical protein
MLIEDESLDTLYPEGFSAKRFLEVIEDEHIWNATERS